MTDSAPPKVGQSAQRLLEWLESCALAGNPCPSNNEIADRFDCGSTATASAMLQRLERSGAIKVERFQNGRMVTICSSGSATRRPANTSPHWRDRSYRAPKTRSAAVTPGPRGVRSPAGGPAGPKSPSDPAGPLPSIAEQVRREAEISSDRKRRARQTGTVSNVIEGLTPAEAVATTFFAEPHDAVAWARRVWPDLWRRNLQLSRELNVLPGEALVRAIRAGLDCMTDDEAGASGAGGLSG